MILGAKDEAKNIFGLWTLSHSKLSAQKPPSTLQPTKRCLIGIGGGGSNILHDISKIDNHHHAIHINSDLMALKSKVGHKTVLKQQV
ncbi:MAG: hypothetical protein U9N49_05075 [Campylobacterota bacterium]|nr:hypothetical protein [Campylobacterota bacterium]